MLTPWKKPRCLDVAVCYSYIVIIVHAYIMRVTLELAQNGNIKTSYLQLLLTFYTIDALSMQY